VNARTKRRGRGSGWWYGLAVAWRWLKGVEQLSIEEAQRQLRSLVKGVRQYGVSGGPVGIGEHEPEAVLLSRARHELLMDLLERHGALDELAEAERREAPSEQDVDEAARQLGVRTGAARR
jgi:hypothetical protein